MPLHEKCTMLTLWLCFSLLILPDELTCESVFYWRMLVQHIKSLGGAEAEEYLDKVLPNGKAFCDYVSGLGLLIIIDKLHVLKCKLNFLIL